MWIAACPLPLAHCRSLPIQCLSRKVRVSIATVFLIGITAPVSGGQPVPVTALAFSPDGAAVVSAAHKSVVVRATKDGKVQRTIACEFPKVMSLAFDGTGSLLAVAGGTPGESGVVALLDWTSGKTIARLDGFDDAVSGIAFAADSARLAVASADHSAKVVRMEKRAFKAAFALAGHSGPVLAVAFSPDGTLVVTASADRTVRVWDANDGKLLRTFSHHTATVHAVAFRPSLRGEAAEAPAFCATASDDKTARVWQPELGRMVRIVRGSEGPVHALAWSRDGARLFTAGAEGSVRVFDADSDQLVHTWRASEDWLYSIAVSPAGPLVATGDWKGSVSLWRLEGPATRRVW
jgi:WD40 repeat protein